MFSTYDAGLEAEINYRRERLNVTAGPVVRRNRRTLRVQRAQVTTATAAAA